MWHVDNLVYHVLARGFSGCPSFSCVAKRLRRLEQQAWGISVCHSLRQALPASHRKSTSEVLDGCPPQIVGWIMRFNKKNTGIDYWLGIVGSFEAADPCFSQLQGLQSIWRSGDACDRPRHLSLNLKPCKSGAQTQSPKLKTSTLNPTPKCGRVFRT